MTSKELAQQVRTHCELELELRILDLKLAMLKALKARLEVLEIFNRDLSRTN